ncbi:MAG: GTPase HflX [Elusimicrobia bacterium]|nr:GTPase HflX [Candidatus Obscuribacterium magneticum]
MKSERVITVGLRKEKESFKTFARRMEELRRLVETAGGGVVAELSQQRLHPVPATYVGSGKLQEIGQTIEDLGVKTVIFDDDLSAAQQKNIEKQIPAKIIDRTRLILDIFARRARTREGQLQVELAQLTYLVPRLTGAWRGFSQQVGGIGTRGPGEKKIEVERRYVRERIKRLKKEIAHIRLAREQARANRQSVPIPQISLVGYTNVGKSTLLNALVEPKGSIYADDKLFATLDPTTRRVKLPGGRTVLFTDTVGFIQNLPDDLMSAFQATLEEVTQSTLLVHMVDGTAENREEQKKTVQDVLKSLQADRISTLTVTNKADQLTDNQKTGIQNNGTLLMSAKTGEGIDFLLKTVEGQLEESLLDVTFELPHTKRNLLSTIYRTGRIVSEKANATSTSLRVKIDPANWKRLSHHLRVHMEENK